MIGYILSEKWQCATTNLKSRRLRVEKQVTLLQKPLNAESAERAEFKKCKINEK